MQLFRRIFGNKLEQRFVFIITAVVALSIMVLGIVVGQQVTTDTYVDVGHSTMLRLLLVKKVLSERDPQYANELLSSVNRVSKGRARMFLIMADGTFIPDDVAIENIQGSVDGLITDVKPAEIDIAGYPSLAWTVPFFFKANDVTNLKSKPLRLGIAHSKAVISERINYVLSRMILIAFAIVILCYFVARSLASFVLKPINRFMSLIRRVSEGEYPKENILVEFQEMEEWAGTFNAMVEQLRQKNSLERLLYEQDKMASLGHLSAAVAHEIRNPLASISSLTQLLAERQKDDRKVQEYTAVILQESNRLNLAIEQLLDFARPIPITFEHLSVREVVSSVITLLGYEADKVSVKLEMSDSKSGSAEESRYPVAGDVNQLKQVLINLVRNSIQAQRTSGGEVIVSICDSPDSNTVEIVVADSGPGIPPDKAEKIFEPFFSTRKKGVGLGLSICRKIINGHGGKISFQNRTARGGAIFSIVLPYDTDSETGTGIAVKMESALKEADPREIV